MSVTTDYMGLKLFDPFGEDASVEGRVYVDSISGTGDDSNFRIIEKYMSGKASLVVQTSAEWDADSATILRANDIGLASDTGIVKFGDGVNVWADLIPADPTYNNFVASGYEGTIAEFYALLANVLAGAGSGSDVVVNFEKAEERKNIESGETLSVLFGKISRMADDAVFADSIIDCGTFGEGGGE